MRVYLVLVSSLVLLAGGIAAQEEAAAGADSKPACSLPVERAEPKEEFDCQALEEFPSEEFEKALSEDEKTKEIVSKYELVDEKSAVCPRAPAEESQEEAAKLVSSSAITRWIKLCPTWSYYIWRWGVYIHPWGRCWVITPIRVTRCATRTCRWVFPWFWSRCRAEYQKVYFLAYCPRAPWRFVWSYKYISRACNCHRLVCGYIRG